MNKRRVRRRFDNPDDLRDFLRQRAVGGGQAPISDLGKQVAGLGRKKAQPLLLAELETRASSAFARPSDLPSGAWDSLLAEARAEHDLLAAIRRAQGDRKGVGVPGRYRVRALAAVCYERGNYDALLVAGETEGAIMRVWAVFSQASNAPDRNARIPLKLRKQS